MQKFNDYQKMDYTARFGSDKVRKLKLYDLIYNGTVIIVNQPYPVCNGKKSELLKTQPKNYQERLFEIKLHT